MFLVRTSERETTVNACKSKDTTADHATTRDRRAEAQPPRLLRRPVLELTDHGVLGVLVDPVDGRKLAPLFPLGGLPSP